MWRRSPPPLPKLAAAEEGEGPGTGGRGAAPTELPGGDKKSEAMGEDGLRDEGGPDEEEA